MSSRRVFSVEMMQAIGSAIREARGRRSQQEMAELLNVSRATLSNYEAGRRLPSAATIDRISEITGASVAEILASKSTDEWGALFRDLGNEDRQRWSLAAALLALERGDAGPWSIERYQDLYETGAVVISLAKHFEADLLESAPSTTWDWNPAGRALVRRVEDMNSSALEVLIRRLREGLAGR